MGDGGQLASLLTTKGPAVELDAGLGHARCCVQSGAGREAPTLPPSVAAFSRGRAVKHSRCPHQLLRERAVKHPRCPHQLLRSVGSGP